MAKTTDMVEISIPRGSDRGDPNLFVAVNGVNYILPRGKKSTVPTFVADEIKRSWEAEERFYESKDILKAEFKEGL